MSLLNREHILFDFDGTIADTSEGIYRGFDYVRDKMGGKQLPRSEYYRMIGPPLTYSFKEIFCFPDNKIEEAMKEYRAYYEKHGLFECTMYEGMKELFETLYDSGKKLYVATSKPEVFAKTLLKHFGIDKYFTDCAGSDMEERKAGKSEIIARLLAKYNIDTKNAVMVGDRMYDVEGAKKVGLDCIGVLFGFGSKEELLKAGAVAVAEKPCDVAKLVL